MEKFTRLEALLFTAVLENCVDQLSILGCIMPVPYEGKTDISCVCASCPLSLKSTSNFSPCLLYLLSVLYKKSAQDFFFCKAFYDPLVKKQ